MESKNIEKYEIYKKMKVNLKKAMKAGFYYQAIFIEYAIIEDRCLSLLRHAGVKYLDNRGWELKLSKKLNKLRTNPAFTKPYVRKRISLDLLDEIENWKKQRDNLIHNLAKMPYNHESIQIIAEDGQKLVNTLDSKTRVVNNYYKK